MSTYKVHTANMSEATLYKTNPHSNELDKIASGEPGKLRELAETLNASVTIGTMDAGSLTAGSVSGRSAPAPPTRFDVVYPPNGSSVVRDHTRRVGYRFSLPSSAALVAEHLRTGVTRSSYAAEASAYEATKHLPAGTENR